MKTDFLGGFYTLRAQPLAAQSCINLYLELNESGSGEEGALLGTPGLILEVPLPDALEVRDMRVAQGNLYAVCGASVYRISSAFGFNLLGTLPNSSGPVSITDNGTQVLFSHQQGWHYCTMTGLLKPVTNNPDMPMGAIVTEQDEYVLFVDALQDAFAITNLNDVTTTDPLDFAAPEGAPDEVVSIISDHVEVWILSKYDFEVWDNTGNALFPFERIPGGLGEIGCAAPRSVVQLDDSIFWVAQSRNGGPTIIRTNAYRPVRISTQTVEFAMEGYTRIDDARAFGYSQEGHTFYVVNFPTADETWTYDCATKLWSKRASMDANGLLHRHRANCYAYFAGKHIVGDFANGNIYSLDLDAFDDAGSVIYRERAWPLADAERHRIRVDRVELVAQTGVGNTNEPLPQIWAQISHDGGYSFGYQRFQSLGEIGNRLVRAVWRRFGIGRQTVLRIATTCRAKIAWLGANVDAEVLG